MSGFFMSKNKGPDAEPTKYTEAALTLCIGGPGRCSREPEWEGITIHRTLSPPGICSSCRSSAAARIN